MERREHPRFEAADRVCITVRSEAADSETFYCTTGDLSANGLRFSGDTSFKQGQVLELLIVRGSAYRSFSLKGRVAWVKSTPDAPQPYSVGIEFADMSEQTRLAWREAVERTQET